MSASYLALCVIPDSIYILSVIPSQVNSNFLRYLRKVEKCPNQPQYSAPTRKIRILQSPTITSFFPSQFQPLIVQFKLPIDPVFFFPGCTPG